MRRGLAHQLVCIEWYVRRVLSAGRSQSTETHSCRLTWRVLDCAVKGGRFCFCDACRSSGQSSVLVGPRTLFLRRSRSRGCEHILVEDLQRCPVSRPKRRCSVLGCREMVKITCTELSIGGWSFWGVASVLRVVGALWSTFYGYLANGV